MIDFETLLQQQTEIRREAENVWEVRRRLSRHLRDLSEAWQGNDASALFSKIQEIDRRLKRLEDEINEIGHDIVANGEDIARAEAEAERARLQEEQNRRI